MQSHPLTHCRSIDNASNHNIKRMRANISIVYVCCEHTRLLLDLEISRLRDSSVHVPWFHPPFSLSNLTHTMDKSHACGCNLLFTLFNLVQIGESEIQRDANTFNLCAPPIISTCVCNTQIQLLSCTSNYYCQLLVGTISLIRLRAGSKAAFQQQASHARPIFCPRVSRRLNLSFSLRRIYLFSGQSVTNG